MIMKNIPGMELGDIVSLKWHVIPEEDKTVWPYLIEADVQ